MSNVKFGADAWNARFSGDGWAYGKEPNAWLEERIKPGTGKALVPADGEGRNAVWIASLGYDTTVFDLSDIGREKCALLAAEKGVEVVYEVDDLSIRDFSTSTYDLIACSWFHVPWSMFCEHYPRMLSSLKSGGEFICEGYHTSQMDMTSGGPKSLDLLWDLDEVMEVISEGFIIKHAKVETVELDESDLHRGTAHVVRLHLIKV
ncbi:MAG: SAM-dependent methyltransferase [Candidatus Poseidoniales archaeon]|nr:MAG: SAM-dependent methyltransferase [Candidatus Poseidoniales archaeon]